MDVREKLVELILSTDLSLSYSHESDALNIADVLIDHGVTVQEWISVKDRLPNYFEHVLINAPGDKPFTTVHEAHLRKDGLWDTGLYRYDKEDVTHWMPLPQPPKGE